MIRYTLLRFLIFFGCLVLLWLIGLRDPEELPWLVVGSALLSMVVSFVLLRPMRDQLVRDLEARRVARSEARGRRDDTDEAVEDAAGGDQPDETYR